MYVFNTIILFISLNFNYVNASRLFCANINETVFFLVSLLIRWRKQDENMETKERNA